MIKRIISIGLTAIMIMSMFVVLDIVPVVRGDVNTPKDDGTGLDAQAGDGIYTTDGDWIVDSTNPTWTGVTILVNGNLNVASLYTLTLQNVTLIMNCPYDGAYAITVEGGPVFDGGNLIIEAVGANPSVIMSNGTGNFEFHVETDTFPGELQMRDSKLLDCGYALNETDYRDGGLWIAGEAIIENNEISNGYAGVIIYQDDPTNAPDVTISGNTIRYCEEAGGIAVMEYQSLTSTLEIGPGNNVNNCYWGVFIGGSINVRVHNNTLQDNGLGGPYGGGLGIQTIETSIASYIEVDNNIIRGNWEYSIWAYSANDLYVHNNVLNGSTRTNLTYFELINGLEMRYNYICEGGQNATVTYFLATEVNNVIFDNNHVNDNNGIGALFNFCWDTEVTNNEFRGNPAGGFGLQYGTYDSLVYNNHVEDNDDMGVHIVGNNINITQNTFISNGDGDPYQGDPSFQDCGIDIMNSYDIYLFDNVFQDNVRTTGIDEVDGIYLFGSERLTTVYMENNILDRNQYNLHCRGGVEAYDTNSTYTKYGGSVNAYDVYLERAIDAYDTNHVTFLNTTFLNTSVNIGTSADGDLTVQWYKHILVQDYLGDPVSGAEVWINDSNGDPDPASGQPFTTDANGRVKYIPLTGYIQDFSGRTYYTPHSVEAKEGDREAAGEANMWRSHYNTLKLNERPRVTDLYTESGPAGNVYRTNTIEIRAEGSDTEDINSDLIPHFEFRVNETSPWLNDTNPYLGTWGYNSGQDYWYISFTPDENAILDNYGFRVSLEDQSPAVSEWFEVDDMVQVLNNLPNGEQIIVLASPPEVLRGQNIDIYADASDIEDDDEDANWDADLQYRLNGTASWATAHVSASYYDPGTGNWKFVFSPPATRPNPNHGPVDFQVKFQDTDDGWSSGWYQELDQVDVLNNIPSLESFSREGTSVYRGDTIRVYADVDDLEETDEDLYVHFYYTQDGFNWADDWLSTPLYGGGGKGQFDGANFFVEFSPPPEADLGIYEFKVYISDSDGGYVTEIPGGNTINVRNNLPTPINIKPSANEVRATGSEFIYLHINASDDEDAENLLTVQVQWQYSEGGPSGVWSSVGISTDTYTGGTPDNGWLRVRFTPPPTSQLGHYDFRAKVTDEDGGASNNPEWVYVNGSVVVVNPEPTLENIKLGYTSIYRGETLEIFLNATDLSDAEEDLTPEIQYKPPSEDWTNIPDTNMQYDSTGDGFWVISFTPADNDEAGTYQFRGRVKNSAGGYSNDGDWTSTVPGTAEIKNNLPQATDIRVEADSVERGGSIYIYADGSDLENDEDDLTPHFEYKGESGSWEDEYLSSSSIRYTGGSWRITFSPPADSDFPLGEYDFKVWFEDDEGDESNELILSEEISDTVEVINVVPIVNSLSIPSSSGYRLDPVTLTADGTDDDHGEAALDAIFEYKGPTGDWQTGNYFGSPLYTNGQWQATFTPDGNAALGDYSFRVRFYDGQDYSDYKEQTNVYEVMNADPEVEIDSPSPGEQPSAEVTFTATASDPEDGNSVSYEWDFGDDSEVSTEESPTHTYSEAGTYIVKLTVSDSDGGDADDTVTITIKTGGGGGDGEPDMMLWLLLLIVIIVVVLLLVVLLMTRKKKKPEGIPPAAPAAMPGAPPAVPGAPLAAPGPPEAPPAVPMAAPAAVPAAVPAAAPAAPPAGQQIKCPKCGTAFAVTSTERPITIECPNCGAKGKLT